MSPAGRPRSTLLQHRALIEQRSHEGFSVGEIYDELTQELNVEGSKRTLRRYMSSWSIKPVQGRTVETTELRRRIAELWFEQGLSDKQMLRFLTINENWAVTMNGLVRIRRGLNIFRRRNDDQIIEAQRHLREFFEDEQYLDNLAVRMGRNMLYVHLRQRMVDVPRNILSQVYPEFHQAGLDFRRNKAYRRRGGWTCHGPNFMWSIDGYMKLSRWGFECYAGIDAYSRYMIWFYTGVSAKTARIVLAQYVRVIQQYGYMPLIVRADRGRETALIAGAHYYLSLHADLSQRPQRPSTLPRPSHHRASLFGNRVVPVIPIRTVGGEHEDAFLPAPGDAAASIEDVDTELIRGTPSLSFRQCWVYGKSTYNVKIERWWGSLSEGRALFWRRFFEQMEESSMWDQHDLADRIALLYIYMPRIRREFAEFVRLWNAHYIRKQKSRPHVVPGKPWVLYHMPNGDNIKDYQVAAPSHILDELLEIIGEDNVDLDSYLPTATIAICDDIIQSVGGIPDRLTQETRIQPYLAEYDKLRARLRVYIDEGYAPKLSLLPSHRGGLAQLNTWLQNRGIDTNNLNVDSDDETDIEIS